jgi:hypothetical protein
VRFRGKARWPALGGAVPRPLGTTGWYTIRSADAEALGSELLRDPGVEAAFLAFAPVPPPDDTPDFRAQEAWLDPAPGLGFAEAARWPGGTGANVTIADVEYGWEPDHEDLTRAPTASAAGLDTFQYAFHGTSVLGILIGTPNGFGVDGAVPDASILMVSPFQEDGTYDVAAAILAAADLLVPGDVLLVEQQAYANGDYCPVSVDPAVYDAIASVTARGIVVVEPGGNGAADLDDPEWQGAFDRSERDSGSILVGAGGSPMGGYVPRAWTGSSAYGSRVDVQGWNDSVVSTTTGDYGGAYADLWYPDDDSTRAYTETFGGTSGASATIAAVAALVQSVAIEETGEPWSPADLRAALVATGTPQPEGDERIGPQPDVRRLLRTYLLE